MATMINGFFPGELKPSATVAGCIEIFESAWPEPQQTITRVEQEVQRIDSSIYWQRATTIGQGTDQNIRTNYMLAITELARTENNALLQNIHNQFNMLLLATTVGYAQRHGLETAMWHEPYGLLKYSSGEQYKAHYDGASETGRAVSAITYLNSNYVGGELEFPNFRVKIKPEPGMLILFPSNFAYQHIAHPVTEGTKYALVTWLKDRQ